MLCSYMASDHTKVSSRISPYSLYTYFCLATTFQNRHQRIVQSDKSERSRKTTKMKMRKDKRSSSVYEIEPEKVSRGEGAADVLINLHPISSLLHGGRTKGQQRALNPST